MLEVVASDESVRVHNVHPEHEDSGRKQDESGEPGTVGTEATDRCHVGDDDHADPAGCRQRPEAQRREVERTHVVEETLGGDCRDDECERQDDERKGSERIPGTVLLWCPQRSECAEEADGQRGDPEELEEAASGMFRLRESFRFEHVVDPADGNGDLGADERSKECGEAAENDRQLE